MNSQATSVTRLTACQSAMAACFVFRREISRTAFWGFCNTIEPLADPGQTPRQVRVGPKPAVGQGVAVGHNPQGALPSRLRSAILLCFARPGRTLATLEYWKVSVVFRHRQVGRRWRRNAVGA